MCRESGAWKHPAGNLPGPSSRQHSPRHILVPRPRSSRPLQQKEQPSARCSGRSAGTITAWPRSTRQPAATSGPAGIIRAAPAATAAPTRPPGTAALRPHPPQLCPDLRCPAQGPQTQAQLGPQQPEPAVLQLRAATAAVRAARRSGRAAQRHAAGAAGAARPLRRWVTLLQRPPLHRYGVSKLPASRTVLALRPRPHADHWPHTREHTGACMLADESRRGQRS